MLTHRYPGLRTGRNKAANKGINLSPIYIYIYIYIVAHMTIARQRLGKLTPEVTLSTIEGHQLLRNGPHALMTIEDGVFLRVPAEEL
jgi:hypothetical protein